jgi:ribonuclease T2
MQPKLVALIVLVLLAIAIAVLETGGQRERSVAFDYYALVLSWSPTYCKGEGRERHDDQCDRGSKRAFTLHGLWPQFEKGWPKDCPTEQRPFVPRSVIDGMRDIMPSSSLIIHEYRAHGTCSGLKPERYFAIARELYQRVAVPPPFKQSDKPLELSLAEIETDFLDANPWLKPDMIAISCRKGQLLDIRVCFDRDLAPRACGANEDQRLLCRLDRVSVPPAD